MNPIKTKFVHSSSNRSNIGCGYHFCHVQSIQQQQQRKRQIIGGWYTILLLQIRIIIIMISFPILMHASKCTIPYSTKPSCFVLRVSRQNRSIQNTFRSFLTQSRTRKQSLLSQSYSLRNNRQPTTTTTKAVSMVAFLSPIQHMLQKYQQQKHQQHQQHQSSPPSNLLTLSIASMTTMAAFVYNGNSNSKDWSIHPPRTITYCSSSSSGSPTIDPNDDHQHNNNNNNYAVATSPVGSSTTTTTSSRNDETKQSIIPQSSSPEQPQQQQQPLLFPPQCFDYDHYSGVTIDLQRIHDEMEHDDPTKNSLNFTERLGQQLQIWKKEGIIRGVWIHVPSQLATYVPTCIEHGFDFHMVTPSTTTATTTNDDNHTSSNNNILILSQWLPDSTSRLPIGPTHQVGVGCLIWHPDDIPSFGSQRRLLVVQEKSGPAAAFRLWKLPTGLTDPNEDIHDAAIRELYEETGLIGHFDGLLLVRQAHPNVIVPTTSSSTVNTTSSSVSVGTTTKDNDDDDQKKRSPKRSSVQRKTSDLFFICQMTLQQQEDQQQDEDEHQLEAQSRSPIWTACPDEIAAIQWMTVQDYCNQQRWQSSPLYMELNRVILDAASSSFNQTLSNPMMGDGVNHTWRRATRMSLWNDTKLPVWVDTNTNATIQPKKVSTYTNTFYSVK